LLAPVPAFVLVALTVTCLIVAYSAWSWRIALAERNRDALAAPEDPGVAPG
jgi:hypothetical protein